MKKIVVAVADLTRSDRYIIMRSYFCSYALAIDVWIVCT